MYINDKGEFKFPFPRPLRFSLLLLLLFFTSGCEDTDLMLLTSAGIDAVNAVTLSDEDVQKISDQAAAEADRNHRLAQPGTPYDKRLQRLVADYGEYQGREFDYKVYLTEEVNAFAMANGTIRIYSGLMDMLNDQELLFVIGHEMGHVVENHSRKQVVMAYGSSALRKALASQQSQVGEIARSVIGSLAQQLVNAQFSQHEERQADNFGARFLENEGYAVDPAVSALKKIADLAGRHTFLSSHPEPISRAERLASGAYKHDLEQPSLFKKVLLTLKKWFFAIIEFVMGFFR